MVWYCILLYGMVFNNILCIFLVFTVNNVPVGLFTFLAYINFPIFFIKQSISVLHLVTASQDVVAYDAAERRKTNS